VGPIPDLSLPPAPLGITIANRDLTTGLAQK
jgi:hypothetical protein